MKKNIFKNIKRGGKYIVFCTQRVSRSKVGLGSGGSFSRGSFVTCKGSPTADPNDSKRPAQVYTRGAEDFPFDFEFDHGSMTDYFAPVPVQVKIEIILQFLPPY